MQHRRALMLESDDAIAAQVEQVLSAEIGMSVSRLSSSDDAMKALVRGGYAMIIADLNMPSNNGVLLLQKLSADRRKRLRLIPSLALLGHETRAVNKLLSELNLNLRVTRKPFTSELFSADVRYCLGLPGATKEGGYQIGDDEHKTFVNLVAANTSKKQGYQEAIAACEKRLAEYPKSSFMWSFLGNLRLDDGDFSGARANAKTAISLESDGLAALGLLARLEVMAGNINQAVVWMEKAASVSPLNVSRQVALGDLHLSRNRPEAAERRFRIACATDPSCLEAKVGLANALLEQGEVHEGEQVLESLPNPEQVSCQMNLRGAILSKSGRPADALELYKKALRYLPKNATKEYAIHYNMALAYLRLGEVQKASRALEKSMESNAHFTKASNRLTALRAGRTSIILPEAVSANPQPQLTEAQLKFLKGHLSTWSSEEEEEVNSPQQLGETPEQVVGQLMEQQAGKELLEDHNFEIIDDRLASANDELLEESIVSRPKAKKRLADVTLKGNSLKVIQDEGDEELLGGKIEDFFDDFQEVS